MSFTFDLQNNTFQHQNFDNSDNFSDIHRILSHQQNGTNIKYKLMFTDNVVEWCDATLLEYAHRSLYSYFNKTNIRKCLIYTRTSGKNEGDSLDMQASNCIGFANQYNLPVFGIYTDNGRSAVKYRDAFQHLLKSLHNGDVLLIWAIDRFHRDIIDGLSILEELHDRNVRIVCVQDMVEYAKNKNHFRSKLLESQIEHEKITERIRNSVKFRRQRGDFFGRAPYGYETYKVNGKRCVRENKQEMDVINKIKGTSSYAVFNKMYGNVYIRGKLVNMNRYRYLKKRNKTSAEMNNVVESFSNFDI